MKPQNLYLLIFSFLLNSCSYFIDSLGDSAPKVHQIKTKKLSLVFSHNINGETHPCGCRHHPLGGLPQVAGKIHEIKQKHPVYYVDSGDTLFDNVEVPKTLIESQSFKAKNILKALNLLNLQLITPGDQDFANGVEFLHELQEKQNLPFLMTNLLDEKAFKKFKKYQIIENGPHKIFIIGTIDPALLRKPKYQQYFDKPIPAIKRSLNVLTEVGYEKANPFHRLILLSHAGFEKDKEIAMAVPQIDWIIGAHSQSFLRKPRIQGNTKIVQVLSRNHYLGEIVFDFTTDKSADKYELHEMRDSVKDLLKPNPFVAFIDQHKADLKKIQIKEQDFLYKQYDKDKKTFPYETAGSCIECHEKQTEFWQGTAHSLAYITLKNANEANNMECIKCHAVGTSEPKGFSHSKDIIKFNTESVAKKHIEKQKEQYWKKLDSALNAPPTAIRDMDTKTRTIISKKWMAHDQKFKVSHNFANVQCLNCHTKSEDHPFDTSEIKPKADKLYSQMKQACMGCHTTDQSPEWYQKDERGIPNEINESTLKAKMEKVACPKSNEVENKP